MTELDSSVAEEELVFCAHVVKLVEANRKSRKRSICDVGMTRDLGWFPSRREERLSRGGSDCDDGRVGQHWRMGTACGRSIRTNVTTMRNGCAADARACHRVKLLTSARGGRL